MTPDNQTKLFRLSPTVRGGLIYVGFLGGSAVFFPFMSVFYAQKALSGSEIGILSAIGPLMSLLVAPGLVAAAEKRGRQVDLLRLSLAGAAVTTLLYPLAWSFASLLVVVVLWGIAGCALFSLSDGLASQMAIKHKVNYGQMRLWGSITWAIFPAVCGVLWQQFGLLPMFVVGAAFYGIVAFILPRIVENPAPHAPVTTAAAPAGAAAMSDPAIAAGVGEADDAEAEAQARAQQAPQTPPDVRLRTLPRRFWLLLACSFFTSLGYGMARTFMAIYFSQLSGQVLVGAFVALSAASEVPAMVGNSRLMARFGGPQTLIGAYGLLTVAFAAAGLLANPWLLLLAAVLQGLGNGLFVPTTVRLVASWAPPGRGSTYQGLMNSGIYGLAPLLASLLGGVIFDAVGVQSVLVSAGGVAMVAVVVMLAARFVSPHFADVVTKPEAATAAS